MIKTRAKANLLRGLADNEGFAEQLGIYQARYGDGASYSVRWIVSTK